MTDKKTTRKRAKKAKVYKGVVSSPFKTGGKEYKPGDVFETKTKSSLDYLIKTKRIKQ